MGFMAKGMLAGLQASLCSKHVGLLMGGQLLELMKDKEADQNLLSLLA